METDEDHATMRESFSLVQNILFIEYTDAFPAHVKENMVEKVWRSDAFMFGYLIVYPKASLTFDSVPWSVLNNSMTFLNIMLHLSGRKVKVRWGWVWVWDGYWYG